MYFLYLLPRKIKKNESQDGESEFLEDKKREQECSRRYERNVSSS